MKRLEHKVALVTGAARGIGAAIAQAFVAEGASVIVSDIDGSGGRATADSLGRWTAGTHGPMRAVSDPLQG